jgi:hypothetical protein
VTAIIIPKFLLQKKSYEITSVFAQILNISVVMLNKGAKHKESVLKER